MKKCLLANIADFTQINEVSSSTISRRHLLTAMKLLPLTENTPKVPSIYNPQKKKEMMPIYNSATTHTCLEFLLVDI